MDSEMTDFGSGETVPAKSEEFSQKIDQLLSTALKDQVEIDKQERHALESLRNDMSRMRQELTATRRAAENPDTKRFDVLEKSLTALGAKIAEIPTHIRSGNEAYSAALIKKIVGESSQLNGAIQAASVASGEKLALETTQLRQATDKRLSAMENIHRAQEQSVDARLTVISEVVTGRLTDIAESLTADVETAQEAIFEHVTQSQAEAAENSAEAMRELKAFIAAGVTNAVSQEVAPFVVRLEKLADRVELADQRITDSNNRVRQMERSLMEYLTDRDEAMEAKRDEALLGLVDKMSESLGKRGRAKVGQAVREAQQRVQDERDAKRYRETLSSGPRPVVDPGPFPKVEPVRSPEPPHLNEPANENIEPDPASSKKQDWASQWIQPGRLRIEDETDNEPGSYVFPQDEAAAAEQKSTQRTGAKKGSASKNPKKSTSR